MKEKIINLLRETKREGIEKLIDFMSENGFFECPCSTQYHLSKDGGLAEHSFNVYVILTQLNESLNTCIPKESLIIVSLLHDLGKAGQFGKPGYVLNMVRSKSKNKETGEYDMVVSSAKPYVTNTELMYEEHEIRSVVIASKFIELTEKEQHAILHHNGLYGKLDSSYGSYYDKDVLSFLLHTADMYCSRFVEKEEVEE